MNIDEKLLEELIRGIIAKELGKGKKVLAIAPDGGEKYISMGLYD